MKKIIVLLIIPATIASCKFLATSFTDKKIYEISNSEVSKSANKYFWDNFHQGNYDSISIIVAKLETALHFATFSYTPELLKKIIRFSCPNGEATGFIIV